MAKDPAIRDAREFEKEEQRLRALEEWPKLAALYEGRAGAVKDPAERERLLYRGGEVASDNLDDAVLAERLYRSAFDVRGSYLPAIGALKVLYQSTGSTKGLEHVLKLELGVTEDAKRRAQLYNELGAILTKKKNKTPALEAYAQAIATYPRSRRALEPLENLARKLDRWDVLVDSYQILAKASKDRQAAVFHFLAGTVQADELKDEKGARASFEASLEAGPKDPRILTSIERALDRAQNWEGLSRALWQHLEVAKDDKERLKLLKQQAALHHQELGKPERAQRLLLDALEIDGKDAAAIAELLKVSEELGDPAGLARGLELEAGLPALSTAERADRLERAAEHHERANEGAQAYEAVKRALALTPESERGLTLLEGLTHRLGKWVEHVSALERRRALLSPDKSASDRAAAVVLLRRIADTHREHLADPAAAEAALRALVQLAPDDGPAWDALVASCKERTDWAGAAKALEDRIKVAGDPPARREARRELAELRRGPLDDVKGAADALEALLGEAPDDGPALEALVAIRRAEGDAEALAGALERLAETTEGSARARALRELGATRLEQGRHDAARRHLQQALTVEPDGEAALGSFGVLVQVAEALDDEALLREALDGVRRLETDVAAGHEARLRLAALDEGAGRTEDALAALLEILAETPDHAAALEGGVRLLEASGQQAEAARRLEAGAVAADPDPPRAGALWARVAALRAGPLAAPAEALVAWEEALRRRPHDEEVVAGAAAAARAADDPERIAQLLEEVTPGLEGAPLSRALRELAALSEEAGKRERAVAALVRLREVAPDDDGVASDLARLYRDLERWPALASLLEQRAEGAPASEQAPLLREVAEVAATHLGDRPRAATALEQVLASEVAGDDPAWSALADLYGQLRRDADRVAVLERAAEREADPARKSERLVAAADCLLTRVGDPERAAEVLARALEATPDRPQVQLAHARALGAAGRHADATAALTAAAEAADAAGDAAAAARVQVEHGRLEEGPLTNADAAEEAYTAAIALDATCVEAHDALVALLERRARWAPLADALDAAAAVHAGEERAALLVRRADVLASRLGRSDDALDALDAARKAAEGTPSVAGCLEARARVLRRDGAPGALADALAEWRGTLAEDAPARLTLLREEAEVRAFGQGELAKGRALLEEARAVRPEDPQTLRALVRVGRRLGEPGPLREHLVALAGVEPDPGRKAGLLVEAGRLAAEHDAPAEAEQLLRDALAAQPNRVDALRWLGQLAQRAGETERALEWLAAEAEATASPERRASLLVQIGRARADEPERAREALQAALKARPGQPAALRALAALHRRTQDHAALAEVLAELAAAEPEDRTAADLWAAAGELRRATGHAEAPAAYEAALQRSPTHRAALRGLRSTLDPKEPAQAKAAADLLRREVDATAQVQERLALAKELATLLAERLDDAGAAAEVLEAALRSAPDDSTLWRDLRAAHVQQRRYDALADVVERQARQAPTARTQEEFFRQAAQIRQYHLEDTAGAAALYREVLRRGDPEALAVQVLPDLYEALGDEAGLEQTLREIPAVVPRTGHAAGALLRLAQREADRGETEAAVLDLEAALDHDLRAEPLDLLARLHREAKEYALEADALLRKRALLPDGPGAGAVLLEAARVLEEDAGDLEQAESALREAQRLLASDEVDAARTDVLERLAQVCRRAQRHAALAEVLGQLAARTPDAPQAAELLIERAELQRSRLDEPRAAIASLEEAFGRHRALGPLGPLIELLDGEGLTEDLIRALEAQAELLEDPEARADALTRVARLSERPRDALAAWERVLDLAPGRLEAYETAEQLARKVEERLVLARLLEREVDQRRGGEAASPERIVQAACEAAELFEAEEPARAVALLEKARAVAPASDAVYQALDRLHQAQGDPKARLELAADRAGRVPSPEARAALHEHAALLARDEVGDPALARVHWEAVLADRPGHAEALASLRADYRQTEQWEDLARTLEADAKSRGEAASSPEDRRGHADTLLELAGVLEQRLQRPDEAIAAYRRAAEAAPRDPAPWTGLERVFSAREDWDGVAEARAALRERAATPAERAQLGLALAAAHEQRQAPDEALAALEAARTEAPGDPAVLAPLRDALLAAGRHASAAEVLAAEADAAPDRASELARRLQRAAVLRDALDDAPGAVAEFERARALAPTDPEPLRALAELRERTGDVAAWVAILDTQAALADDPALAADLLTRAGELSAEASPGDAAARYRRARALVPDRAPDLEALAVLERQLEQWSALARTLHDRADLAGSADEDPGPWLREAAEVEEQQLEDPGLAASTLQRLVQLAPDDGEALAELTRVREVLAQHGARAELLARRAALTDGAPRRELLRERARVLEQELGRHAAAAEALRLAEETLADASGEAEQSELRDLAQERARLATLAHDPAGALAALEVALANTHDDDVATLLVRVAELAAGEAGRPARATEARKRLYELDPAADGRAEALAEAYRREGRHEALAELLGAEVERRADPASAGPLLHERGALLRGPLGQPAAAGDCYRALLAHDPDDDVARAALEAICRSEGDDDALLGLLAERAERAAGDDAAEALLEEATVHERWDRADEALARLARAAELAETPALRCRALRARLRLLRAGDDAEALAAGLETLATEPSLTAAERAAAQVELGNVRADLLEQPDAALEAFGQAEQLEPGNVAALRGQQRLLAESVDTAALVAAYRREIESKVDDARRVWLHARVGHLLRDDSSDEAAAAYDAALALDPESLVALRGRAEVARDQGTPEPLTTALEALARLAPSAVDRQEACRELGLLYEEALGDPAKAAPWSQAAVELVPDDRESVQGLARTLEATGNVAGLVEALELDLSLARDDDDRHRLALAAARAREALASKQTIPEARRAQLERALAHARLACELEPGDAGAHGLYGGLVEQLGRWDLLVEVMTRLAEIVDDTPRASWMLRRAAQVCQVRLSDPQAAVATLRKAVELDPGDVEAWQALEPLADDVEDMALLHEVLERRMALAGSGADRAEFALKLGRVRLQLGRPGDAIAALTLARNDGRGPTRTEALALLESTCRQLERWDDLIELLAVRAQDPQTPNRRDLLRERAHILEHRLDRADQAIEVRVQLYREQPDGDNVLQELERALKAQGRFRELTDLYEVEAQRRGRGGFEALLRKGRIARDELEDLDLAADALQRAVTLNPTALELLTELKSVYDLTQRWSQLLDTLRLEIGLVRDAKAKEQLQREAAQVAEQRLGDLATAARFYADAASANQGDLGLLQALERVQAARGEYAGAVETLGRQLPLVQDRRETLRLLLRQAGLLRNELGRPTAAIEVYSKVLAIDSDHDEAQAALCDLYRAEHAWADLARTLERRAQKATGPEQRALSLELAEVEAERLGRPDPALQAAAQALAQDAGCLEALQLQVDVLRRWSTEGPTPALAQALDRLAARLEGSRRAEVLVELSQVQEGLGQAAPALEALRQAHQADPGHVQATDRLLAQLEAAGQTDEAIAVCEAAGRASAGFRVGELLAETGRILEARGEPAQAEKRFRAALAVAPGHPPALRGLVRVLVAAGAGAVGAERTAAEELARRLVRLAKLERDRRASAAALAQSGDVLRDALGLYGAALRQYQHALELDPELLDARAGVGELSYAGGDYAGAARALDVLAASPLLADDPERAAELLWIRGLCHAHQGRRAQAAASWRAALELRPGHLQALEDLSALLVEDRAWSAARAQLEELVSRSLGRRARAEHALTLARVAGELGDDDRALACYREGLAVFPRRADAQLALGKLLRERDAEAARQHLELAAAVAESPAVQAEARMALADLLEAVLDQPDLAAGHLEAAARIPGPHRAEARRLLADVHGRSERWPEAVHCLLDAIRLEPERGARAKLLARLGRALRDRIRQPALARRCFEESLELDPRQAKTLDSLMRLLEITADRPAQVRALGLAATAAQADGNPGEAALRFQRVEPLLALGAKAEAIVELERVVALEPAHSGARAALAPLYLETGRTDALEELHRAVLANEPFEVASYRALRRAWSQSGRNAAADQAAQVLAVLNALDRAGADAIRQRSGAAPRLRVNVDDTGFASALVHPACSGPLFDLLCEAGPLLMKQIPDDLKGHGIGWRTSRYGIEGDVFPEHGLVKRVCDALGIGELDVYWLPDWRKPEPIIGHSKGNPALLLCPEVFEGLSEAAKLFVLARALAPVRDHLQFFRATAPAEAERLVLALLKGLDGSRTFEGDDDRSLRGLIKAASRADLSAAARDAASTVWRRRADLDATAFQRGVRLTAARSGLLVAGGPHPAVEAIVHTNVSLRGRVPDTTAGATRAFRDQPEVADLLPFAVSEPFLRLQAACRGGG